MVNDQVTANVPYGFVPTMEAINALPKEYKVFSTFSGVGGSSMGYKMAGMNVIASVEFLDYQAATYRANHPSTRVYEGDIRELDPQKIMQDLGIVKGELDVLDGSPPCSGFSTSGSREKGWGKKKKYGNTEQVVDDLFHEFARFLKAMQPKVFVAENVTGLIKGSAKGYFKEIFRALSACGYHVKAKVLCAKHYGVPQARERLIFIGVRNDLNIEPSYPVPNKKSITHQEAWKDIIIPENVNEEMVRALLPYQNGMLGMLKKIPKNPKRVLFGSDFHPRGSYFNLSRLSLYAPACTLMASHGNLGTSGACHPLHDRKLHIEELKAISSFPKDFKFIGDYNKQWEACGRSVPPLMMYEIAKHVKENIFDKIKENKVDNNESQ